MATYNVNRETGELIPVSGGTLYADTPVGTILPYGGTVAPAGWLICDGSALKRSTYAELFSVIGTQFGVGDGSTTFNIPDMREAVPKGAGLTGKSVGNHVSTNGLSVGEFVDDRLQDHQHHFLSNDSGTGYAFCPDIRNVSSANVNNTSTSTGEITSSFRKGFTTEVKSVGVNYIIKAQRVAVPADFVNSIEDTLSDMGIGTVISNSGSAESVSNSLFDIVSIQVPRGKWVVVVKSAITISDDVLVYITLSGSELTISDCTTSNIAPAGNHITASSIVVNDTDSDKTLTLQGYGYATYTQFGTVTGIKVA